jgi:hypothetical protein
MGCVTPVEAAGPDKGHDISAVFSLTPSGMAPNTLNRARRRAV